MTLKDHFEAFMAYRYPQMSLTFDEAGQFYYHDIAQVAWQAVKEMSGKRPTENSRSTKELRQAPHPETLVDRLNGIYGQVTYPPSKLDLEAADEIIRLRGTVR